MAIYRISAQRGLAANDLIADSLVAAKIDKTESAS